jgi:hypothetical protein
LKSSREGVSFVSMNDDQPGNERRNEAPLGAPRKGEDAQIAGLVAAGFTNDDIARELSISPGTVTRRCAEPQKSAEASCRTDEKYSEGLEGVLRPPDQRSPHVECS